MSGRSFVFSPMAMAFLFDSTLETAIVKTLGLRHFPWLFTCNLPLWLLLEIGILLYQKSRLTIPTCL
jgi:hypothetical protein